MLIEPSGANSIEILIKMQQFSFNKMHFNMSSVKRRPFCLILSMLDYCELLINRDNFSLKLLTKDTPWKDCPGQELVLPRFNKKIRKFSLV